MVLSLEEDTQNDSADFSIGPTRDGPLPALQTCMETWTLDAPHLTFLQPAVSPRPPWLRIKAQSKARAHELFARLPQDGLAIVGTRRPSRRALHDVHRVLTQLSPDSGRIIISGLAFGLDAEAHEAALKLGFPTIAVLAGGVEDVYPSAHRELAMRILAQGGVIVSEKLDDHSKPWKGEFLARNRIISALSKAVWIAEAGDPSGALSTAHWAVNQGVDVYATPFHPSDAVGAGNRKLLLRSQAIRFGRPRACVRLGLICVYARIHRSRKHPQWGRANKNCGNCCETRTASADP